MISRHPVSHQLYADDTKLYSSSRPSEINATFHNMKKCICDVKSWMICNKFQMNDKTEAILIATQRTSLSHALPPTLNINGIPNEFSKSLRNLGIIFDNSFSLHQNIMNTCRAAYIEWKRISSISHFPSVDATKTLMCSLVLSKLDYCNSLLFGSPQYFIQLFQNFKIQLLGLLLKPQELNILHPSFVPFTGYLYKKESSTRSALFVMLHLLAQV